MAKDELSKISVDELSRKLADLSVPEEELAKYFEVDEEVSTPTRPVLKLNPDTVKVPPPSGDMAALADAVGYHATTLLTMEATREAVIGAIKGAAASMQAGDIFLMTYSGHGGQVPDFSGDEALERQGDYEDETLCLYDGQLIDDELYALWAAFPAEAGCSCSPTAATRAPTSGRPPWRRWSARLPPPASGCG